MEYLLDFADDHVLDKAYAYLLPAKDFLPSSLLKQVNSPRPLLPSHIQLLHLDLLLLFLAFCSAQLGLRAEENVLDGSWDRRGQGVCF